MKLRRKKITTGCYELVTEEGEAIARAAQFGDTPQDYCWEWTLINGWYFGQRDVEDHGVVKLLVLAANEVAGRAEEYGLVKG